jgi:hypothetical protein
MHPSFLEPSKNELKEARTQHFEFRYNARRTLYSRTLPRKESKVERLCARNGMRSKCRNFQVESIETFAC